MTATVTSKGQVTIPKPVRDLLGIVPGTQVEFRRRADGSAVLVRAATRNGAGGGAGPYGSSKAFVSNVTRGMAKEWIGDGIRVNAVAPGVIATPFHERYSTQAQMDAMPATIPQARLGSAEDCVGAYLFLASDTLSGFVIGQTIEVNGGQLMP